VDLHHPNPYAGLLKSATDGSPMMVATRAWQGKRRRVLVNSNGWDGKASIRSFPFQSFDEAFRRLLAEINPAEVLGTQAPDEVSVLTAEHARLEARLAALEQELEAGDDVATVAKVARKVEGQLRAVAAKLADARHQAAHPLSSAWGEAGSLVDAMDGDPDKADAYTRFRTALRRVCAEIQMLVVPRGRDRLAAVQAFFKRDDAGEVRSRNYLIFHRTAVRGRKGGWRAGSLADVVGADDLDLRRPADARRREKTLAEVDASALWEALA
jgi:hypothetical protein